MIDRFAKALGLGLGLAAVEKLLLPPAGLGFLTTVPRGYGLVIGVISVTYLWVLMLGMKVGAARSKYSALAEKDGEKEIAERYQLPNLYAQGTSKHARAFNCVQRSHQQILETFTGYCCTVLFTGWLYPVTAFVLASLWLYSRAVWV